MGLLDIFKKTITGNPLKDQNRKQSISTKKRLCPKLELENGASIDSLPISQKEYYLFVSENNEWEKYGGKVELDQYLTDFDKENESSAVIFVPWPAAIECAKNYGGRLPTNKELENARQKTNFRIGGRGTVRYWEMCSIDGKTNCIIDLATGELDDEMPEPNGVCFNYITFRCVYQA